MEDESKKENVMNERKQKKMNEFLNKQIVTNEKGLKAIRER